MSDPQQSSQANLPDSIAARIADVVDALAWPGPYGDAYSIVDHVVSDIAAAPLPLPRVALTLALAARSYIGAMPEHSEFRVQLLDRIVSALARRENDKPDGGDFVIPPRNAKPATEVLAAADLETLSAKHDHAAAPTSKMLASAVLASAGPDDITAVIPTSDVIETMPEQHGVSVVVRAVSADELARIAAGGRSGPSPTSSRSESAPARVDRLLAEAEAAGRVSFVDSIAPNSLGYCPETGAMSYEGPRRVEYRRTPSGRLVSSPL